MIKKLLLTVALLSFACIPVAAEQVGPSFNSSTRTQNTSESKDSKDKTKGLFQGFFASDETKKAEGERLKKRVLEKTEIGMDQLHTIMDKLPPNDKNVLSAIKTQIATWSPEIFEEISSYREFVINSRKIAQQKYESLSSEAKTALETEKKLKAQLTQETVKALEALDVTAASNR